MNIQVVSSRQVDSTWTRRLVIDFITNISSNVEFLTGASILVKCLGHENDLVDKKDILINYLFPQSIFLFEEVLHQ